jgi:hypothetical protein
VPVAVVFLLRAVVLVLLWGFVVAAVVAVRHDVFGTKAAKTPPLITPPSPKPAAAPKPAPAPKPTRRRRSAAPAQLTVVEGPARGTSVALSSLPVTIGRASASTVVLSEDVVSNNHARLVPRGDEWLVEDLGSTNGTLVDGAKVSSPVVVRSGSKITIGTNVLELR